MKLRPARPADAPAIAALWNTLIRDSLATFTTAEKTDADIEALIATRGPGFLVSEGDMLSGFATYGPFRAGPGYAATAEHTIILHPRAQGQGIGAALLARLEDHAAKAGIHVMIAGISSANPAAVQFHAKQGFVQTGRLPEVGRKAGQWLDLILMQKTLDRP